MDQITVRYLINGTVCTDVFIGETASVQPLPHSLRVKLAKSGVVIRDWLPEPFPVVTAFYKNAEVCYYGPVEKKYLDVA